MLISHTFNLETVGVNEARIFEHIGRFTVEAAHIDQRLSVLLAWATGAGDWKKAQSIFADLTVSTKLNLLKKALPEDWGDKNALMNAVQKIQNYRNNLAHSTVHTLLNVDTGDAQYIKKRESKGGQRETIDLDELKTWELRASMLHAALLVLTNSFLVTREIREAELRTLCFQVRHDPTPETLAALDFILPARG
ncbi:hypothetical protein ACSBOX_21380 (plasmid) [Arthrobacter sp. KN11-1C]|uniref:hypothetical protein n=1 Tax=Arthrobacter sp. KN11-1C TaxID=3445774 RepID=UPI003F9EC11D